MFQVKSADRSEQSADCRHEAVALLLHPPLLTCSGRRQSVRLVGAMHAVFIGPSSYASASVCARPTEP